MLDTLASTCVDICMLNDHRTYPRKGSHPSVHPPGLLIHLRCSVSEVGTVKIPFLQGTRQLPRKATRRHSQAEMLISRTTFCLFRLSHSLLSPSLPGRAYTPLVNGQGIADQSRLGVLGLLELPWNQNICVEHVHMQDTRTGLPFSIISPTNTFAKPATI